ncbi:MAG: 16S rRNA (cytosine(1402)-N(4))-methyltransferase [Candidatus Staskawiczbacteria bacterium RIFCSPLOWO2_12_FULL_37_15]|uniref:Ribosomal RNA small subunit methyltransferase H n=1 Tax=Candidatus Staskawiczbacteria bacterium RIFCSPLOWO2_12_FULL_37_15 TaxID=1802218 RepID=A0A1G2IQL4_9BACT|nr:MAG: Ribosomal RNA small subunit methyltransferase H [Parcubacteria group bacterium GW2011_GWA2_37_10]OGZ76448.1 MAG: 16S rRNA (cytosine(1402)-N(4))-methyltransferase [Candidatus Staskawiczbacteria bacterium RIFCSPLOWO2_12_FULL_37_15]
MIHKPVLVKEVLEYLSPKPNENFIDCTVGEGGHAEVILEKTGLNGKVLGIDLDQNQINNCKLNLAKFKERAILVNDSYGNLKDIVEKNSFEPVNGILLDLGMSSAQLESTRGFSFQKDQPLDMRYNNISDLTAEIIINDWQEEQIKKILEEYGEERFAKQVAKKITEERKSKRIESTFQLTDIIKKAIPAKFQNNRIHCATRTFQALRIAVNGELNNLEKVLPKIVSILEPQGRLAIISFHSLEDRLVKNFLKNKEKERNIKILTKSPITADFEELRKNSRSRSAKLRAAIKN